MTQEIELTRDKAHPSLAGTGTMYVCAQVRLTGAASVRYQCNGAEWSYSLTPDIAQWLAKQPAPWASTAGSNAKYTPCLIRPEDSTNKQMRVQVPGTPGLNREWGAEFIHSGPCSPAAVAVIQAATATALGTPEPEDDAEANPDPSPEPDEEEDDDEEEEEDNEYGPGIGKSDDDDKAPF